MVQRKLQVIFHHTWLHRLAMMFAIKEKLLHRLPSWVSELDFRCVIEILVIKCRATTRDNRDEVLILL